MVYGIIYTMSNKAFASLFFLVIFMLATTQHAMATGSAASSKVCKETYPNIVVAIKSLKKDFVPDGRNNSAKEFIEYIQGHTLVVLGRKHIDRSPFAAELRLIADLTIAGNYVSAAALWSETPGLKSDPAGKAAGAFFGSMYAPVTDVLTREDVEFAAAINNAAKRLDATKNALGEKWKIRGVELFVRGAIYHDALARRAGLAVACVSLKESDIQNLIRIGARIESD